MTEKQEPELPPELEGSAELLAEQVEEAIEEGRSPLDSDAGENEDGDEEET